ncbi:hypothetical protein [Bacillus sp. FJAT-45037]|uniref:hypothetical protein n=1 Tax=Bacillus sp. FJAT-45037 TaxID=2011007 RepID=UPI000C244B0C|nr:hypothetical protein [Bacillus sp. FJAT-45037]
MKQVMQEVKHIDREKRIPVLRLEIDYELVTMHDAMLQEDLVLINQTKSRLEALSHELTQLQQ